MIFGDGKQTRDFVYVGDCAAVRCQALAAARAGDFASFIALTGDVAAVRLERRLRVGERGMRFWVWEQEAVVWS